MNIFETPKEKPEYETLFHKVKAGEVFTQGRVVYIKIKVDGPNAVIIGMLRDSTTGFASQVAEPGECVYFDNTRKVIVWPDAAFYLRG